MAKEALSFLHDSNAHRDPKMLQVRMKFGWEGYGFFWGFVEVLRESADHSLRKDELGAVAFGLCVDPARAAEFIQCYVSLGLLSDADGIIRSPALDRRMERYESIREKRRSSGSKGGLSRVSQATEGLHPEAKADEEKEDAKQEHSKCLANAEQVVSLREYQTKPTERKETEQKPEGSAEGNPPEPPDPYLVEAERHLEQPKDQAWTRSSAWIAAQRRPMKKYPSVFLSSVELANVLKVYADKVPKSKLKIAFQACQAQIANQQVATGKKPETVAAFNHLIGFHYQNLLDALRKEEQLEQTEARRA